MASVEDQNSYQLQTEGESSMGKMTGRQAIKIAALSTVVVSLCSQLLASDKYPHATLAEAFKEAHFDPHDQGSMFFVVAADPHVGRKNVPEFPPQIINELNAMKAPPKFLLVNGDLIESASRYFGNIPGKAQKKKAIAEFTTIKQNLSVLNPEIAQKFTLGNHDTYPYEKDGELFRTVFKDQKVYESFDMEGVHFICLNGAQSGDIDEKQLAWLVADVAKQPKDKTIISFVHQPALGALVNERGIGQAIKKAFAKHEGKLWLVAGHNHANTVRVFTLPKTKIVQASMCTCNNLIWGGHEKPGYWIYCVKNGMLQTRIFRKLDGAYRIDAKPNLAKARKISTAFDSTENIVQKIMVGADRNYLISHKAKDVVTWWAYTKELVYKFPLTGFEKKPTKLAVLGLLYHHLKDKRTAKIFLSADGENWTQMDLPKPKDAVYLFELPAEVVGAENVHLKLEGPGFGGGVMVGGFALCL
jgi:hypothetical protein